MGTIAGTVKENGLPVGGRIVRAYRRDTGALLGSSVSSDGLPVAGDANLSDRVLLIRGDGNSIVDQCPTPRLVTVVGNASIVDDEAAFGGRAIYFDGSGDYLTLDAHSSLAFGTGDLTIEMRVRPLSIAQDMTLIDFRPAYSNGAYPVVTLTSTGAINLYVNGSERIVGAHGLSTTSYGHVAYCRAGGVGRLFAKGLLVGSWADETNYGVGGTRPIIGALGYREDLANAHMFAQSIRLSRRAEYTAPFTPPEQQFYANEPAAATPIGSYSISTSHAGEVMVVCLDDSGGATYNDLIARTTPV